MYINHQMAMHRNRWKNPLVYKKSTGLIVLFLIDVTITHLSQMEFSSLIKLDQSLSVLRVVRWYFFIFIQILLEFSVRKQWRP